MNDSKGSVVVRDRGAADLGADAVVVPDYGGEREDALGYPCADAGEGASAVCFQVELALEGVVDRLDDLTQGFEELFSGAGPLALAGRAQQIDPGRGDCASNAAP